jgi:hypothetical protein
MLATPDTLRQIPVYLKIEAIMVAWKKRVTTHSAFGTIRPLPRGRYAIDKYRVTVNGLTVLVQWGPPGWLEDNCWQVTIDGCEGMHDELSEAAKLALEARKSPAGALDARKAIEAWRIERW